MSDQRNGGIAWTDQTWNPVRGCSRVSDGCTNCYAETMAARFCGAGQPYEGTINPETKRWNGKVRLVHEHLEDPLHWKRPRRIFVNSMSDLFHPEVPDKFIDNIFAVMALCQQHTFQVLTKRPERMLEYVARRTTMPNIDQLAFELARDKLNGTHIGSEWEAIKWTLPNVHLGVTIENQQAADERIPLLLQTPAAVRWVSVEPMLDAVDLERVLWPDKVAHRVDVLRGGYWCKAPHMLGAPSAEIGEPKGGFVNHSDMPATLDWVVCGGESGANARPMHPDWVRGLRDQCKAADVPFMFKQWGEWVPMMGCVQGVTVRGEKHIHQDGTIMGRAGKKAAGRLLDGVLHDGYPVE